MPGRRPNPWLVLTAATVPAVLELAQMSIAGVATRYIVGGLGGTPANGFWVSTAYLASAAVMIAMSGWFADHLGRKRYLLISLAGFVGATLLCGLATSLDELIAWRIVQGLFAGGLQPCGQAVILDAFPKDRQAVPLAVFSAATIGGLLTAPALGGWLADTYSWRWPFLAAVPVGLVALAAVAVVLEDPPALEARRAVLLARPFRFDYLGFGLIAVGITSAQVFLGKGQEWDWFGDPFHRVHLAFVGAVVGLGLAVRRQLRAHEPLFDQRPLADRHFAVCGGIIFVGLGLLFGSTAVLTVLLTSLFGYDATTVGFVMAPAGACGIPTVVVALWLLGRGMDGRRLVFFGALLVAAGCFWMSRLDLAISPDEVMAPRAVQVVGLVLVLVPLFAVAYRFIPTERQPAAAGLFSFLRFTGGTVGAALGTTLLVRRDQFHTVRVNAWLDPLNPGLMNAHRALRADYFRLTGDPAAADAMGWSSLAALRDQQALSLACFDVFWVAGWAAVGLAGLALFMRKSVPSK